jgi:predicted lipase
VTNTSRLIAVAAGTYSVVACVQFVANATGVRAVQVRKNAAGSNAGGTLVAQANSGLASSSAGNSAIVVRDVVLAVNDYLEVFIYQSSGGALATVAGTGYTYASMRWVAKS